MFEEDIDCVHWESELIECSCEDQEEDSNKDKD